MATPSPGKKEVLCPYTNLSASIALWQTGMQQLGHNKTNPVKDIWYFIKVAVFFLFNNCGWMLGTAHDNKWTLHSCGMQFPVIHPDRALQAIASVGVHCHMQLTYIFFMLSCLAKSEFWDNLLFYPQTEWMHQQKIFYLWVQRWQF